MSIVVTALIFSGCTGLAVNSPSPTARPVALTAMDSTPPPGVNVPGAHWIKIQGAGGVAKSEQVAAVLRPPGPGPFPLLIVLGGTLTDTSVELAARLASAGFVALAGCWQLRTVPPYTLQLYERKATIIACPRLLADERDAVAALIAVGRKQPGVRTDAVGLYGASAGGQAVLDVIAARRDIRAAVLDSPEGTFPEAATINAPILVLAGTADTTDGNFTAQKNYVEALQQAGKDVEWHYYEGGRHVLLNDSANEDDATRRTIDYLTRRLMAGT